MHPISNRRSFLLISRILLVLVGLFAAKNASVARADVDGTIQLGNEFGPCSVTDDAPRVQTVYVVHTLTTGAIASRFRLEAGEGMTMTYLSESHPVQAIGNVNNGLSVCYGSCQNSILVAVVQYMGYGTSASCSEIHVVPYPGEDAVEALDCDGVPVSLVSRDLFVGRVPGNCGCGNGRLYVGTPRVFNCEPVTTQGSTWGAIKSLYRN